MSFDHVVIAAARLAGRLPLRVRRAIGTFLGHLLALAPTRDRTIAALQLRCFLGEPVPVSAVYAEIGRMALETVNLDPILAASDTMIRFPAAAEVDRWIAEGRPILALTGHIGNWELLGAYVRRRGIRVVTIGQEAQRPVFHDYLSELRERHGVQVVLRTNQSGPRAIAREMKQGGIVAALIDQDTAVRGIPVPFFGSPAYTPVGLIELAHRLGGRIVTAFLVRDRDGGFTLEVNEIEEGLGEPEVLRVYHEHLERIIRRFPAQWVWFHKRWRTLPDGVRRSSREYLRDLRLLAAERG